MKISICIPVMGREKMLMQAIHSILLQEHEDFEIVIRDDDPNNPVQKHPGVHKLLSSDRRIVYIIEKHIGTFSGIANAALRHATGEILYVMGSDDLLAPGALYEVNKSFTEDRFGGAFWLYGKTISTNSHLQIQGYDGQPTTYEKLLQMNRIGCPSAFWNRPMMNLAGTFDTRYKWAADYDLWLRFWKVRDPMFVNHELGIFRHHDSHMSVDHAREVEEEAAHISQRHATLSGLILHARISQLMKKAYDTMPPTSDK